MVNKKRKYAIEIGHLLNTSFRISTEIKSRNYISVYLSAYNFALLAYRGVYPLDSEDDHKEYLKKFADSVYIKIDGETVF